MTEFDIQKRLVDTFLTLDSFATANGFLGEPYFMTDTSGNVLNVHEPNKPFEVPENKRWFDLTFRNNDPVDASIGGDSQSRFTGVFYIDVMTEQDVGEEEVSAIYRWIAKLFNSVNIDVVDIMKIYISNKGNDADYYKLQIAIEWEADIDKE